HARNILSIEAVTNLLPSGLNWQNNTALACSRAGVVGAPLTTSQMRAVRSPAQVATRELSGLNTASNTGPKCSIVPRPAPVAASQSCARPSMDPVTIHFPSPEKLADKSATTGLSAIMF